MKSSWCLQNNFFACSIYCANMHIDFCQHNFPFSNLLISPVFKLQSSNKCLQTQKYCRRFPTWNHQLHKIKPEDVIMSLAGPPGCYSQHTLTVHVHVLLDINLCYIIHISFVCVTELGYGSWRWSITNISGHAEKLFPCWFAIIFFNILYNLFFITLNFTVSIKEIVLLT